MKVGKLGTLIPAINVVVVLINVIVILLQPAGWC